MSGRSNGVRISATPEEGENRETFLADLSILNAASKAIRHRRHRLGSDRLLAALGRLLSLSRTIPVIIMIKLSIM